MKVYHLFLSWRLPLGFLQINAEQELGVAYGISSSGDSLVLSPGQSSLLLPLAPQSEIIKEKDYTQFGSQEFRCNYCPTKMYYRSKMVQHVRTHTGEKPFDCSFCPLAFQRKSTLKKHCLGVHRISEVEFNKSVAGRFLSVFS